MSGKKPLDLDKYQDTQSRVSGSISISGGQHAQATTQARYPHSPIEKPTRAKPNLRVIEGGRSSQGQGNNAPRNQAIPKSLLKRLPPALLAHPFLWGVALGAIGANVILEEDETDLMTGEPIKETAPEESVDYLVNEIKRYDPDYTYPHDKDESGVSFLANLLHYEKLNYYNKHRNACRQDFNPDLYTKTVRDLDAREDILNTLYGSELQDDMLKREHDMYLADGGKLSRSDWMSKGKPDPLADKNSSNRKLFSNQVPGNLTQELADAARVGVKPIHADDPSFEKVVNQGTIKFVVTDSGELLITPHTAKNVEISHAVLSRGKPVQAAGQADIAGTTGNFIGIGITSHSGHFLNNATLEQSSRSLQTAKEAFENLNIVFPE